jgi:phosphotransferase system enzyme I (PtsI)
VPAAPGIAVGPARRLEDPLETIPERAIPASGVDREIARFREALDGARRELTELRNSTRNDLDEETARIFDVQLMVLEDPLAVDRTEEAIRNEKKNAEFLFRRHMVEMTESLKALSDSHFSERAVDLSDVKRRVLRHLSGDGARPRELSGVLMVRELAPSDAVMLQPGQVLGFATDFGGATSHAAIMARARGIPAVVGAKGVSDAVVDGETVAVDGFQGVVEINPTPETLARLQSRQEAWDRLVEQQAKLEDLPTETRDGHRIILSANMEIPAELEYITRRGGDGIGLFRTEFFFMWSQRPPSEEEQVTVYREILERMKDAVVTIRALDVGGDKIASYLGIARERNPFFGVRGVRYLIAHPKLFTTQLRAVLRAAPSGNARLLVPMVSSLGEFRTVKRMVAQCAAALAKEGRTHADTLPIGAMIEIPSAVFMADEIAAEADFLSVGSNDLIQYTLAIDRDNESLHHLYQPHHPAVLRALDLTVAAAHRHGKPASLCGEMAGDPLSAPLLVGLGFDQLSVSPSMIPDVKQAIRAVSRERCRDLVTEALACNDPMEVTRLIETKLSKEFAEFLSLFNDTGRNSGTMPRPDGIPGKPAGRS